MSDIIVRFKPQGEKGLIDAIKKLEIAQGKATDTGKKFRLETGRNRKAMSGFEQTMATVRSRILVYNFAMAMGVRQMTMFGQAAAKLQSVEKAFNTLSGGINNSSVAIEKLRKATDGTMSDFDLFQQANNAMILGVSKNSDEMAELFDMAQRLGRALGRDTRLSVESLVTGIGRQSRQMLDNIGIIVSAEDAYKKYAAANNLTASSLTDAQKKQAFLNATLESARQKVSTLGEETFTAQDSFDKLSSSTKNLTDRMGETVNQGFVPLLNATTDLIDAIDTQKIQEFFRILISLGTAFAAIKLPAIIASLVSGFAKLVSPIGKVATVIGVLTYGAQKLYDIFGDSEEVTNKLNKSQTDLSNTLIKSTDFMRNFVESAFDYSVQLGESQGLSTDMVETQQLLEKAYQGSTQGQLAALQVQIEFARALALNGDLTDRQILGLEELQEKFDNLIGKESTKVKLNNIATLANALGDLTSSTGKNAKISARLSQSAAIISAYAGANKAFEQGGALGFITSAAILAQGLANVAKIETQLSQMGGTESAPQFAEGGYVGGRPHSQGGTMIEAERGEFVMSRNAVESIGLETLNQMNQSGGGGGINVTVTGNVLTQDFVEGELAESIKEAVRRGSDFGLN